MKRLTKLSGSPQGIPQYMDVPLNIEVAQIVSFYFTGLSY